MSASRGGERRRRTEQKLLKLHKKEVKNNNNKKTLLQHVSLEPFGGNKITLVMKTQTRRQLELKDIIKGHLNVAERLSDATKTGGEGGVCQPAPETSCEQR